MIGLRDADELIALLRLEHAVPPSEGSTGLVARMRGSVRKTVNRAVGHEGGYFADRLNRLLGDNSFHCE
jgi:hypothetical protein